MYLPLRIRKIIKRIMANHLNFIAYVEQVHKISVHLLHDHSYRNVSAFRSVKEFINLRVGVSEVFIFLLENKIK